MKSLTARQKQIRKDKIIAMHKQRPGISAKEAAAAAKCSFNVIAEVRKYMVEQGIWSPVNMNAGKDRQSAYMKYAARRKKKKEEAKEENEKPQRKNPLHTAWR